MLKSTESLKEVKEAIQKAKATKLVKKPIKPIISSQKFQRSVELKKIEEKKQVKTEKDIKNELDNLIKEIKTILDKTLKKKKYKQALTLCNKLKDINIKIEYNQKLKNIYEQLIG